MNYKDLFDRYRKGLLNEEEKQLVEKELERHEAVEDYLSQALDEEFSEIKAGVNFDEEQEEETIKVKKSVSKWVKKIILTSVLIVVTLYIGIFYGASGFIDRMYYDPTATTQAENQDYPSSDFRFDMEAYVSLNMPGYSIMSSTFAEPKGFGDYEVNYTLLDLFSKSEQRHFVNLSRGELTYAVDGIFSREKRFEVWDGFEKIKYFPEDSNDAIESREGRILWKNEETLNYLDELNKHSYISMSIIFDEDLSMEDLYYLSIEETSLDFKWVGVRTVEPNTLWDESQPIHLIGFNPNFNDEASSSSRPDSERYPLFYLLDIFDDTDLMKMKHPEAMASAYEIHFRSRLDYLRTREDFINIFDYNSYKKDFYDDSIAYIDENGIKTYGVLVFGTVEEFLESIDKIPYASLHINEVLTVKPNIYY